MAEKKKAFVSNSYRLSNESSSSVGRERKTRVFFYKSMERTDGLIRMIPKVLVLHCLPTSCHIPYRKLFSVPGACILHRRGVLLGGERIKAIKKWFYFDERKEAKSAHHFSCLLFFFSPFIFFLLFSLFLFYFSFQRRRLPTGRRI